MALAATVVISQLHVLWDGNFDAYRDEIARLDPIPLAGPTLFISDLQLTGPGHTYTPDLSGVTAIVIAGDFFENPDVFRWQFGDSDRERIKAGLDTFLPPTFRGDVYWISSHNHDPQLALVEYDYDGVTFRHIGKLARFEIDGLKIVTTHGEWFFAGVYGGGVSRAFDLVGLELPLERIGRRKLQLPEDTWLISAHSHVPEIDQGAQTANTGSFVGVPLNFLLGVDVGTGLRVEDGEVDLVHLW